MSEEITDNLEVLRSGRGSLKGVRLRKKLRKSVSLPTTPSSENYKFVPDPAQDAVARATSPERPTSGRGLPGLICGFHGNSTISLSEDKLQKSSGAKGVAFLMDNSPALSKTRTQKFHKLFKSVPSHEFPIDYFSCAYIGDILLQGNLYVSQNWFCFYSRIRGRGRLLEIPMTDVISITREKTAIIFPNAIGLQTKEEKYAFGSFISRDNTYKFLVSMWKKSQESNAALNVERLSVKTRSSTTSRDSTASSGNIAEEETGIDHDLDPTACDLEATGEVTDSFNDSIINHSKSDSTDQSDLNVCLQCGSVGPGDSEAGPAVPSDKSETSSPSHVAMCSHKNHLHQHSSKEKKMSHVRRKGLETSAQHKFPYSVMYYVDRKKTIEALQTSAVKLQKIPRTNLLLAICTLLVLFLLASSVGLTYKILDLEAKLASSRPWTPSSLGDLQYRTYGNIVGLQGTVHLSTLQHMQNILQANIRILEQINSNLRSLQSSTKSNESLEEDGDS